MSKQFARMYARRSDLLAENLRVFDQCVAERRTLSGSEKRNIEKRKRAIDDLDLTLRDGRMAGMEDTLEYRSSADGDRPHVDPKRQLSDFAVWMAGGWNALSPEQRSQYQARESLSETEQRALASLTGGSQIATGTTGATLVPQGFQLEIDTATKYIGGVPEIADFIDTDDGRLMPFPTIDDTQNTGEVTDENAAVTGSDASGAGAEVDPVFGAAPIAAWMHDSGFVRVPIQLSQDAAFDTAELLKDTLTTRIIRKLNSNCTSGDGTAKPRGFTVDAGVANTTPTGHPTDISYSDILTLKYSLDRSYRLRPKCAWQMADATLKSLQGIVDGAGRPLWAEQGVDEGIVNGAPLRLLGHPVIVNNSLPLPSASSKPVYFGDWSRYKIRRVRQMVVVKADQLFLAQLQIGYLAFQRFDGRLINTNAIKFMQMAAS